MGFGAEAAARLFDRFSQADETISRRFGGTGLGLSICRSLTDLMGGDISATSEPGRGSLFRVTLPMSMPGILSGSLLVFALSISSYIVPALMGGFRVGVLPIHIFQQVAEGARFQFGATIAVILFLLSAGAVAVYLRGRFEIRW